MRSSVCWSFDRGISRLAEAKHLVAITSEMNVRNIRAGDGWLALVLTRADEAVKDEAGKYTGWRDAVGVYLRE